ncbi:MAG: ABC transporter permease [Proteobacteria bacterium]|nr:ABC transporter permease [Pseudomonadota bacterium]
MTAAVTSPRKVRPFAWSVRRELWEHRSIFFAPLAIAGVVILGFLVSTMGMPERRLQTLHLDAAHQSVLMGEPYAFAEAAVTAAVVIVAWFYCLSAMFNERRDRSILFWKSLPVSDTTATLAKMFVPLVAAPVVAFVLIAATEGLILLLSTVILVAGGVSAATPWTVGSVAAEGVALVYGLACMSLWMAPVYAWFVMISAWARRMPFLWAVLPPIALAIFERLAFRTSYIGDVLTDRLSGAERHALVAGAGLHFHDGKGPMPIPPSGLAALDPAKFLSTPGLWIGLAAAAALVALSVWLRRRREPI